MSQDPGSVSERRDWRFYVRWSLLGAAVIITGFVGWTGWKLWSAWRSVERIEFALEDARGALPPPSLAPEDPSAPIWDPPDRAFVSYLLVGSDASDRKDVAAADSITLFLDPGRGEGPILVSLPRDLLVPSPCRGGLDRLGASLAGCEGFRGPEVVSLAVEAYTGIAVDHFAVFGFEGFVRVVDELGGIEICVDHAFATRPDPRVPILEPGCQVADGRRALTWVRSRTPFALVDGEWVPIDPGDEGRRERQQDFLVAVLRELRGLRSINQLTDLAQDLADTFALDDSLSLLDAVGRIWDLRDVSPSAIIRVAIPTTPGVTPDGDFALVPEAAFAEVLVAAFPRAADYYR